MKFYVKLFALILALLFIIFTLAACNNEENTSGSDNTTQTIPMEESESETEFLPDVEKKDYGAGFHMMIQEQSNVFDYYWVEESSNDALSEAIYNRQQLIRDYLGVDITATPAGAHNAYGTPFMTSVKNKDGAVDTLLSHSYMFLPAFVQEGYLMDYNDIEGINLEADYWSLNVMEGVATGDHLYLGYSDYRLANTMVITFNKEMLNKY